MTLSYDLTSEVVEYTSHVEHIFGHLCLSFLYEPLVICMENNSSDILLNFPSCVQWKNTFGQHWNNMMSKRDIIFHFLYNITL